MKRFVPLIVFALVLTVTMLVPLSATGDDGRPEGSTADAPPETTAVQGDDATGWDGDGPAPRVLHSGNVTVDGSQCVGTDCNTDPPSPGYGFNTIRLQENNLRILAFDTSGGAFPTRDWQIEFNSSSNGGASYYMVRDCGDTASTGSRCSGTAQFTIEAGADNDSIYVDSSGNQGGNVGFGTTSPAVDLDVLSGNTPTLRLQQDASSGFGIQTWDVAGNEANFFVRDVTNGSALPIRIEPGVASNTLYLDSAELIGFGTSSPTEELHIRTAENPRIRLHDSSPNAGANANWTFGMNNAGDFFIQGDGGVAYRMSDDGLLRLQGVATAPPGANDGDLYVDSSGAGTLCFRTGGAWVAVAGPGPCS